MIVYHNLKLSKKELFLSKKGSHSRKKLHIVVNCYIQNCGKVNDVLFPHPYTCIHFIFLYIHIHTQSRVLYAYLETQRCRDLGSGLNISKTFFIGYFSLPRSAVILYFTTCYTEKYFQIQFFVAWLKSICCFSSR